MNLKAELYRLKQEAKSRAPKSRDPADSMTLTELDAEIAKLDQQLIELGTTPEEVGVESHQSSVGYWIKQGYNPENAEKLASTI